MAEPDTASTTATADRAAQPAAQAGAADVDVTGGTYDLLLRRLRASGTELTRRAGELNSARTTFFGSTAMTVANSQRLRTHNPTVPRDLVAIGDLLLFGYNVHVGLRANTQVSDVFSLHHLGHDGQTASLSDVAAGDPANFLCDKRFGKDFSELYAYYKDATLLDFRLTTGKLLAAFRTGRTVADLKVFRWDVSPDGDVRYLDNRGERDYPQPHRHDFEWTPVSRDHYAGGRFPHINIADEVFIDPRGGTLDLRAEDGTARGRVVLSEPVNSPKQELADCNVRYAQLDTLILLGIKPYGEAAERFYVYNTVTEQALRVDALGTTCQTLPEDHGIIFPGGFHLGDGTHKTFDIEVADMEFTLRRLSPNGEDVLYVFHRRESGQYLLLSYNLIRREVAPPLSCHGASVFSDGTLVVFREDPAGPSRVHTVQLWTSPYCSEEHAGTQPRVSSPLATIGNAELVRAISEAFSIRRLVETAEPTMGTFESVVAATTRMLDAHHWLGDGELADLASPVRELQSVAELVLDEFEKVEALRGQAQAAVAAAAERVSQLARDLSGDLADAAAHISGLSQLRQAQGTLLTLRDMRYADTHRLAQLQTQVEQTFDDLADRTVAYLSAAGALAPLQQQARAVARSAEQLTKVADGTALRVELDRLTGELSVLSEVVSGLEVADSTVRTGILERVAEVLGAVNRSGAVLDGRLTALRTQESAAAFAAEFALLSQGVSSALAAATTPEDADAQLGRLMTSLENLDSTFGDVADYAEAIASKREQVYEAFTSRKQSLLDARTAHAIRLVDAARRSLSTVARRASTLTSAEEVNAFFASDPLIVRIRRSASELREIGESVKGDELDGAVKAAQTDAVRALRDRLDMFEDGDLVRLGRHRFTVNTSPLALTLAATDAGMELLLTGTDYRVPVTDPQFAATRPYWSQPLVSEDAQVYRGEYLAWAVLSAAESGQGLTLAQLTDARRSRSLQALVTAQLPGRFDEGYERGVHDADAAAILEALLRLTDTAGLARYTSDSRAQAQLFFAGLDDTAGRELASRARSVVALRSTLGADAGVRALTDEIEQAMGRLVAAQSLPSVGPAADAARYLVEELGTGQRAFVRTAEGKALLSAFGDSLATSRSDLEFRALLTGLGRRREAVELATAWLSAFAEGRRGHATVPEAVVELVLPGLSRYDLSAALSGQVTGLLGSHPRISAGTLTVRVDEFTGRLGAYSRDIVPSYRQYQQQRHALLDRERKRLRLEEFSATVMSGFVRNQLIDQVYLPMIGENLAKQIGAAGSDRRTDQMGLLLIVSPPGYGKTTLMEYVANRLGMVMVKVNGPALGHAVTSLDPAEAPDATSRREVERINFALQLGNNVMLYLDDIQHTSPELLQKFISLADATRRIEGVVDGQARTFDLRGKRFAVCMAGNPYTESGEKFQIPDMLANRADTYNLGEILTGNDELFALSYVENALTANPVLAPLAGRDPADIGLLVRMAAGEPVEATDLSHPYSALELTDIVAVLRRLRQVQQLLLKVNAAYIASASQGASYRDEPPFLLQGSYRNMGKLAARVVPVMNDAELESLVTDHYTSEAQTLTSGAEENLLKLAELRGTMTDEQRLRWQQIKAAFVRSRDLGDDRDPATRIALAIDQLGGRLTTPSPTLDPASIGAALRQLALSCSAQQRGELLALADRVVELSTA